jgi:class 3 adenylate cyclase
MSVERASAPRVRKAVAVIDSVGFSAFMRAHGIDAALLRLGVFRGTAWACVALHGGMLVKAVADNIYAVFDRREDAEAACAALLANLGPDSISAGIAEGEILLLADDLWGDAVNRASDLGEEQAGSGEILTDGVGRG